MDVFSKDFNYSIKGSQPEEFVIQLWTCVFSGEKQPVNLSLISFSQLQNNAWYNHGLHWMADLTVIFLLLFLIFQWGYRCCSSCNCNKVLDRCSQASNTGKLVPLVWPWEGQFKNIYLVIKQIIEQNKYNNLILIVNYIWCCRLEVGVKFTKD